MNGIPYGRSLRAAVLLQVLGLAGCHHRTAANYPPPPPLAPTSNGSNTSAEAGTAPSPVPRGKPILDEVGMASWYGPPYAGAKAADGTVYNENALTAANRELPLGSIARVTNLTNNESVVVRINDHGPFYGDRIIDLSLAAAKEIGVYRAGVAKVRVEAYAPPGGYDPAGQWCVQIGAFGYREDAIQLKNDLTRRYSTAKVIEFAGATGHWVRIYPKNPDRATADRIADSIHIPDPDVQPYLVRLN